MFGSVLGDLISSLNRGTSGCGIAAANEFEACEFLLLAEDICY